MNKQIEHQIDKFAEQLHEFAEQIYEKGYSDGKGQKWTEEQLKAESEMYIKGLNDAWKYVEKAIYYWVKNDDDHVVVYHDLFDSWSITDLFNYSASEVIAKIKEYEEKHTEKSCNNCGHNYQTCAVNMCRDGDTRKLWIPKQNDDVKDVFKNCDTCKYLSLKADDFPCDRCCHRYISQYVYDDKREANADG